MEDDGPVAVEHDPVLGMPVDGPGEALGLDVTTRLRQLFGIEGVVDAGDTLLDDGSRTGSCATCSAAS